LKNSEDDSDNEDRISAVQSTERQKLPSDCLQYSQRSASTVSQKSDVSSTSLPENCHGEDASKPDNDKSSRTSVDSKLASIAETTPTASESAPHTDPPLAEQTVDANQDWEVRDIIAKEDVDGVVHYLVDWHPTLVPTHSLGNAKELVDIFEARLRAHRRSKNKRGWLSLKPSRQAIVGTDTLGGAPQKKRRGRPRKQR
jgi:hypothetical protein